MEGERVRLKGEGEQRQREKQSGRDETEHRPPDGCSLPVVKDSPSLGGSLGKEDGNSEGPL